MPWKCLGIFSTLFFNPLKNLISILGALSDLLILFVFSMEGIFRTLTWKRKHNGEVRKVTLFKRYLSSKNKLQMETESDW